MKFFFAAFLQFFNFSIIIIYNSFEKENFLCNTNNNQSHIIFMHKTPPDFLLLFCYTMSSPFYKNPHSKTFFFYSMALTGDKIGETSLVLAVSLAEVRVCVEYYIEILNKFTLLTFLDNDSGCIKI